MYFLIPQCDQNDPKVAELTRSDLTDLRYDEGVCVRLSVEPGLLDVAGVDDVDDPVDCDRGFGNIRRYHHLPTAINQSISSYHYLTTAINQSVATTTFLQQSISSYHHLPTAINQ